MIIEGIVTTLDSSGELNVAPMGPIVDESMSRLTLRPFQTSKTYKNLKAAPHGVFHVVDDVLLIAKAALDRLDIVPPTFSATCIDGQVLADCCRWYEFEITQFEDFEQRTTLEASIVHTGRVRDFFGFNRAKHAVLEATIVATRLQLIPEFEVRQQLASLAVPVQKTCGPREKAAFELVTSYINDWYKTETSNP